MLQLNVSIICGTVLKDPYNDHYLNESLLTWIQKRHVNWLGTSFKWLLPVLGQTILNNNWCE